MKAANFFRSGAILFPLSILALLAGCACAPPEFNEELWERQTGAPDPSLLYAAHTDSDGAFFNPWMERSPQRSGGSFFFRKKMKFDAFPEENYAHVENNYEYLADGNFDSISFAGHASVIIKMNGETVFADPFFSGRAAVVEKKVKIKIDFS
ncbi:MAG: hypothetical protein LBD71_03790, partial [Treponema sp.]|nr:hypothetical protein [Treponema sp.]